LTLHASSCDLSDVARLIPRRPSVASTVLPNLGTNRSSHTAETRHESSRNISAAAAGLAG